MRTQSNWYFIFLSLIAIYQTMAAQVIDHNDYSVMASSSWVADRQPELIINGSGLNDPAGDTGATHINGQSGSNYSWHTRYNPNGIVEHAWLIFDLGGSYSLESMQIWNYNHTGSGGAETTRSIRQYNLWLRNDDSAGNNSADSNQPFDSTGWTLLLENAVLNPAPGNNNYTGQNIKLDATVARRVAIEILSNYDGYDVTGDGAPDTDPFGPLVGCSEVRFFQTIAPIKILPENMELKEGGSPDTYSIELLQPPADEVIITLENASTPDQLQIEPATLTFNPANWNLPQSVTIRALNDSILESNPHQATIDHKLTSTDPVFSGTIFKLPISILETDCGAWGFDPLDLNFDCRVDLADLSRLFQHWLACTIPNESGCQPVNSQKSGAIIHTAYDLPQFAPLFDFPLRDTCILLGPDGQYYLTGTTGHPVWWTQNDGIRMYRSSDLIHWEQMDQPGDNDGLIWSLEKEGTWARRWVNGYRAVWAPELHYINDNYWLTYCMNWPGEGGTGILKSVSGSPQGPYVDVKTDGPLTSQIDASLFQDDDGAVYFIWQNGKIWQMNDQLDGFVGQWQMLRPSNHDEVGFEGAFIYQINNRYYLGAASVQTGRYDFAVASAEALMGPYGPQYIAVPHGGHNILFRDSTGRLLSTFFGSDNTTPIRERAAFLPVKVDENGILTQIPDSGISSAVYSWRYSTTAPPSEWTALGYDDTHWTAGTAGFGQISTSNSVVRTEWSSPDIWLRRTFELDGPWQNYLNLILNVFHTGNTEIYLNHHLIATLPGNSYDYSRIPLEPSVSQYLLTGTNVISVHCSGNGSNQFIDLGLYCDNE